MIYKNIEFHNVDHLEQVPGMNGLKLHRFPEHFSKELGITNNHNGRFRAERPHGCEIRFVTEAEYFDIALTAMEADIDIILYSNCYINQAAIRLGYDVLNKGLSGSCLCEKIAIDYLSELKVDVLSMEIGVNMVMFFDEREFRERTEYLLSKIIKSPAKEIFIITMFPNKGLIAKDVYSKYYVHYRAFNKAVSELMKDVTDSRIRLIPGEDILKNFTYLSTDLLHPSDNGHIRMGEHLANWMKER